MTLGSHDMRHLQGLGFLHTISFQGLLTELLGQIKEITSRV